MGCWRTAGAAGCLVAPPTPACLGGGGRGDKERKTTGQNDRDHQWTSCHCIHMLSQATCVCLSEPTLYILGLPGEVPVFNSQGP